MRKAVVWLTLICFVSARTTALADPHSEGVAAGQAANPVARNSVSTSSASTVVPGYTTTPAESTYYRQPNLATQGNARLAQCSTTPNDPVCLAQLGAMRSANTPRTAVTANDPAVLGAESIARSPSLVLEDLASFYSGCTTSTSTLPAGSQARQCTRYEGVGNYTTRRDLNVQVELVPSCDAGDWFSQNQVNRNDVDYMVAQAQCRIRADGLQRFRFYAAGSNGACIDWQELDLPTTTNGEPQFVADLSPHWSGYCWSPFKVVLMPGSGCTAGSCHYQFQFGTPTYACSDGTVLGSTLSGYWGGQDVALGPPDQCFTVSEPNPDTGCPLGTDAVDDQAGMHCAAFSADATLTGASGWNVPLSFQQATMTPIESDVWDDKGTEMDPAGRCTVASPPRCVDGPGAKNIDGHEITRDCWSYEQTLSCSGTAAQSDCGPLVAQGCTPLGSACKQSNPDTGACEIHQDSYSCPMAAQTVTSAGNCPSNVFCMQGNCFDISTTADTDFGRSMSMLEAAREAGVYLDTSQMQVFKGEDNRCRDLILTNCCQSDNAGAGMTNQSMFGVGSRVVYGVLMNANNRQFIVQGMSALLMGGGFSGSFTSYGVTVAVNGTALPAGSVAVYAGDSLVVAFDPWSLAISVIMYIVLDLMSCNEEEGKLAMKEGARLCHTLGTWCSSCVMVLGVCVTCIEYTTSKCCFNSLLARIVNEQGRAQINKGWGDAKSPDCSGFTVEQLQSLDFATMDLSEFYASLVPTLPDVGALQTNSAGRVPMCYYGQGRCQ